MNVDKSILSDVRYPAMRDVIESNLRGPIVDAPGTFSLGSGGPMRGSILRAQAVRVLREKHYTDEEIGQAMLRYKIERSEVVKAA